MAKLMAYRKNLPKCGKEDARKRLGLKQLKHEDERTHETPKTVLKTAMMLIMMTM